MCVCSLDKAEKKARWFMGLQLVRLAFVSSVRCGTLRTGVTQEMLRFYPKEHTGYVHKFIVTKFSKLKINSKRIMPKLFLAFE